MSFGFYQVENLLISARGQIKLCDFGSSTTKQLFPDETWTALQRSLAEDEVFAKDFNLTSQS